MTSDDCAARGSFRSPCERTKEHETASLFELLVDFSTNQRARDKRAVSSCGNENVQGAVHGRWHPAAPA